MHSRGGPQILHCVQDDIEKGIFSVILSEAKNLNPLSRGVGVCEKHTLTPLTDEFSGCILTHPLPPLERGENSKLKPKKET